MADEVISRRRMLEDVGLIAGGALPGDPVGFGVHPGRRAERRDAQRVLAWLDESV